MSAKFINPFNSLRSLAYLPTLLQRIVLVNPIYKYLQMQITQIHEKIDNYILYYVPNNVIQERILKDNPIK